MLESPSQNAIQKLNNQDSSKADYLVLDSIDVSFGNTDVVRSLSMQLAKGEIGCLLGFSGCGKTTALRAIAGLEQPQQGLIKLNGRTLTDIEDNKVNIQIVPAKRDMGMVFQDYALFTHLSVSENVGFGLHRWSKSDKIARVKEVLELVELSAHADKRIDELSGGQQQRIALARALAPKPELLLLDEPFSNLDMMLRESLAGKVRDILKRTGTTAILVTHDQHEAFAIADKIGVMHRGKLAQWATPDVLYHQPSTPFIAEFIGEGAMIEGVVDEGVIRTALGDIKRQPQPIHADNHTMMQHSLSGLDADNEPIVSKLDTIKSDASKSDKDNDEKYCYDYPNGTKIKVLIRPDDIVHDDNSPQRAMIVGRVFRGANFLYRLRLDNGEEVLSLVSSHHDHPVGSAIGFRPCLAHVVLFQNNGFDATTWYRI